MCFSLENTSEYGVKTYEKRDVSQDLLLYPYHPPGEQTVEKCAHLSCQKTGLYQTLLCNMTKARSESLIMLFSSLCGLIEDVFLFMCCSSGLGLKKYSYLCF